MTRAQIIGMYLNDLKEGFVLDKAIERIEMIKVIMEIELKERKTKNTIGVGLVITKEDMKAKDE